MSQLRGNESTFEAATIGRLQILGYRMPRPNNVSVGVCLMLYTNNRYTSYLVGKRKSEFNKGKWCFPGGWVDYDDESFVKAAIREFGEEVEPFHFDPNGFKFVYHAFTKYPDFMCITHYVAYNLFFQRPFISSELDKIDEWKWMESSALLLMHDDGELFPDMEKAIQTHARMLWRGEG